MQKIILGFRTVEITNRIAFQQHKYTGQRGNSRMAFFLSRMADSYLGLTPRSQRIGGRTM
jgi:hypothetical protein